jgi:outer membrane lipoprotein-sorting protein
MCRLAPLSLFVVVSFAAVSPLPLRAADPSDASAVVKKGIAFLGGEKKLKSFKAATYQDKGTYYGMGDALPYAGKFAVLWPDKFRMEIVGIFTTVVDGKTGWNSSQGKVRDLSKKEVASAEQGHYESLVTQLHPLLDGKTFKLSLDGKATVGKTKTVVVKVSRKGRQDVRLFFNPATGELLKSETMAIPEDLADKLVKQESFYTEYKTAKGIKYPSKFLVLRGGKKYIESTLTSYTPLETLPAKTFAKPK